MDVSSVKDIEIEKTDKEEAVDDMIDEEMENLSDMD